MDVTKIDATRKRPGGRFIFFRIKDHVKSFNLKKLLAKQERIISKTASEKNFHDTFFGKKSLTAKFSSGVHFVTSKNYKLT